MATKKTDLRDRKLVKLMRNNSKLRAACIVALNQLSGMTTGQFSIGLDRPIRELLAKVIEQTK